jgi:hypothetical protein
MHRDKFSIGKILKVFLHPPPPLERESLVKVAGLIIEQKRNLLSTKKSDCEKNLFGSIPGDI